MEKQKIKSVAVFAVVLMVLSIIPSGALASGNATSANQTNSTTNDGFGKMMPGGMRHEGAGHDGMHCMDFCPAENITEENFTEVQANVLDSITERIAELQSMYTNVSEATTAEELQQVLLAERQANDKGMGPCENGFHGKMGIPCLFEVENVTDDNYTDVQAEIVNSIGNMTEMLNEQMENSTDDNMTEMLNEQITELEELSTNVSEASSAAELQEVVLTYMKAQAVESIEKEVERIETRVSEGENSTYGNVTELNNKITELNAQIDNINAAESFDELREIMSSEMKSENCPVQDERGPMNGKGPMQQGGWGKMPECPCSQQNNSTEA